MYNVAFTGILLVGASLGRDMDQQSKAMLQAMGVFWGSFFCSFAFVLPRLLELRKDHMETAPSNFITEVSNQRATYHQHPPPRDGPHDDGREKKENMIILPPGSIVNCNRNDTSRDNNDSNNKRGANYPSDDVPSQDHSSCTDLSTHLQSGADDDIAEHSGDKKNGNDDDDEGSIDNNLPSLSTSPVDVRQGTTLEGLSEEVASSEGIDSNVKATSSLASASFTEKLTS
jgi:hypothetical protein